MKLLVNLLSVGSLSGEHVAFGFTTALVRHLGTDNQLFVLHYQGQPVPTKLQGPKVQLLPVSERLRHWALRSVWEPFAIRRHVRRYAIDRVVGFAGMLTSWVSAPQVVIAQNPWAFVTRARKGVGDELKAYLQRLAYRRAYFGAYKMLYVSDHLRGKYERHFQKGTEQPAPSSVIGEGLEEELFQASRAHESAPRTPFSVLSVSVYAHWKGVETVVAAISRLRDSGVPATLSLVGPWADPAYERRIREQVQTLGLGEVVLFHDRVARSVLHHHYASHQVFCLMSRCESFGIPAAEAMAFGTPIVSSKDCAISEICQGAGYFGPADSAEWTADTLRDLLSDSHARERFSEAARARAAKLTWDNAARPLIEALGLPLAEADAGSPARPEASVA